MFGETSGIKVSVFPIFSKSGMTQALHHARLIRPGDWLVLVLGLVAVAVLITRFWLGERQGERLLIRQGGAVFLNAPLTHDLSADVSGPLGMTHIELVGRRARVLRDPGPRQLCVRQGWISRAGEAAICLPNQVSIEITGASTQYDSLNY